ncbi:MAG: GTP-dependent dephospho-CoA kinase family protein [Halobacteriales archaeon]
MGPVYTDADELLSAAGDPVLAVGDVVTAHLERAGRQPDVAVVDERTEREAVDADVAAQLREPDATVRNPAATLTRELLAALGEAIRAGEPRTVMVDGEEDLATLPAVLSAPEGASVVYGQPGEGMVLVAVDEQARARVRELFDLLDGDREAALAALGVA